MVNLIAKDPLEGGLPLQVGKAHLQEMMPQAITSVTAGATSRLDLFNKASGVAFPGPGRSSGDDNARAVWMAPETCYFLGHAISMIEGYALTDQSDGWVVLRLAGEDARDVLARLTPVDLRPDHFGLGQTARTLLGHMQASITRVDDNSYDLMVFRSMAQTALHDLSRAMHQIAARSTL